MSYLINCFQIPKHSILSSDVLNLPPPLHVQKYSFLVFLSLLTQCNTEQFSLLHCPSFQICCLRGCRCFGKRVVQLFQGLTVLLTAKAVQIATLESDPPLIRTTYGIVLFPRINSNFLVTKVR